MARPTLLAVLLAASAPALTWPQSRVDEVRLGFEGVAGEGVPSLWRHVELGKGATRYALVQEHGELLLRAVAKDAGSCLLRPVPAGLLDGNRSPGLRWRWRVARATGGDGRDRERDDLPARVWVGFATDWSRAGWLERRAAADARARYGFEPPGTWIQYVWAGGGRQRGEAFDEPYAPERVKCVALRCGPDRAWQVESVDPCADWRRLFGGTPPQVCAVGVMSDADDQGGQVEADYADLAFVCSSAAAGR